MNADASVHAASQASPAKGLAEQALGIMRRVRARLVTDHPFFGDLALRLVLKADAECRDMWTDGRTLAFNPLFVTCTKEDKLAGAQAHEVLHLVFGHHLRRRQREKALWNRACDLAVNGILIEAGFQLPEGFLYNADYAGRSADDIYDILLQRLAESSAEGAKRQGRDSQGSESSIKQDNLAGKNAASLGVRSPNDGAGSAGLGDDGERSRQEGRGVKPVKGRHSPGSKTDGKTAAFDGEVRDYAADADGEGAEDLRQKAELEAEMTLTRALNRAKNMGSIPLGVLRQVEQHAAGYSVDWRDVLQRFLSSCADNDYTWSAPNRRYLSQDIYMPSRWEQRLKNVVVAVDSSGSVDTATLALFMGELKRLLESYETELTILFHDTRVQKIEHVSRFGFDQEIVPAGGGGTDFRPVPEAVAKEGLDPACLLWFTDLECTSFPAAPDYPVLWLSTGCGSDKPPFGEVVSLKA